MGLSGMKGRGHQTCRRCPRVGYTGFVRGLCSMCYSATRKKVAAGETTWAAEEAAGRCLAPAPTAPGPGDG